jgi:hypothetical protein
MYDEMICGTGRPCEQFCPVMALGRTCPGLTDFLDEITGPNALVPSCAPQLEDRTLRS